MPLISHAFAAAGALVFVLSSCAPTASRVVEKVFPLDATLVQVRNEGFADVVIYVLRAGTPMRLGLVRGNSEDTFELPQGVVDAALLELVARPIAGDAYSIPPVNVAQGQQVELIVSSQPRLSHAAVWDRD